jgi:spermidine/putrescine transport system substrate-binding protein
MKSFHEQYPNITLKTSAMDSNEAAVAKIQAGFEVDVINSCVDEAALEMVQKGMYMQLDTSRLTYWNDLFPSVKELPGVVADGKFYVVPVDMGAGGILYNVDVVDPAPDSWTDLFDPQWKGRVSVENNATTAIMIGALVTGVEDPLNMSEAQLDQVKQYWIDHKGQFRTFYTQGAQIRTLFKSGEVVLASGYADNAAMIRDEGVNVEGDAREGDPWACGTASANIDPANLDAACAPRWYEPGGRAVRGRDLELSGGEPEGARHRAS